MERLRASKLLAGLHGLRNITNIYIDGVPHELADDGDTLLPTVESAEQRLHNEWLIAELSPKN